MSAQPRPADPHCGLGLSPSDARQSHAEGRVCAHAERLLNMVHGYCQIRDSWTGWVRGRSMRNTIQRIRSELRALEAAEKRVMDKPSVTLLPVLDYAARAREAVPHYTPCPRQPQAPVLNETREACKRMSAEAGEAERVAKQAIAREYAARMAEAIRSERAEEARRQKAMDERGITETPEEAERVAAAVRRRIDLYAGERHRALTEAGLDPDEGAPEPEYADDHDDLHVVWTYGGGGLYYLDPEASGPLPERVRRPARQHKAMLLLDRKTENGRRRVLKVWTEPRQDEITLTVNGATVTATHVRGKMCEARLSEDELEDIRS